MDPNALRCPHSFYAERRLDPPVYDPLVGAWLVTRDADIREVLNDTDRFSNRGATGRIAARRLKQVLNEAIASGEATPELMARLHIGAQRVLLDADPPQHGRQRALVSRAFTTRAVAELEPSVRSLCNDLLDGLAGVEVDVLRSFCREVPLQVIAGQLGIGGNDLDLFAKWSDAFTGSLGNDATPSELAGMLRLQVAFFEHFTHELDRVKACPRDDVLTKVATARLADGATLSLGEQLGMTSQFVVAGNETTSKAIAAAIRLLGQDPDLERMVRADRALIPAFVEEVIRLESPTQGMFRIAKEPVVVGGVDINTNECLFLVYGSANRDETVWAQPEQVNLDRPSGNNHLGFGRGEHYCLGASLARLEMRIALEVFLDRVPKIRLCDRNDYDVEVSWFVHGLRSLWVDLSAVESRAATVDLAAAEASPS